MCSRRISLIRAWVFGACAIASTASRADEPKPTAANTISISLPAAEAIKPQTFSRPLKFFVVDVIDRSGNAQPKLVYKHRGGIFLDRTPAEIIRAGLADTLRAGELLAQERESADFLLTVYVFNFGLGAGSGMDFFGKVELACQLKNAKTGKSQQITASGTSIADAALRKKNIQRNVQSDIERAFADALRNFLRGEQLRAAVTALDAAEGGREPAGEPATQHEATGKDKPPAELGETEKRGGSP